MTKPEDLDVLRRIADRSLEGHSMCAYTLHEAGIEPGAVRSLELEGRLRSATRTAIRLSL